MTAQVFNRGNTMPTWSWMVTMYPTAEPMHGYPVEVTKVGDAKEEETSTREFVAKTDGRYQVYVTATAASLCSDGTTLNVQVPGPQPYVFRVTPPRGMGIPEQESSGILKTQDSCGGVPGPCVDQIQLVPGVKASISPQNRGELIPSYVRLSLFPSAVTVEGYTGDGPMSPFLLPDVIYDVLVIPDGAYAPTVMSVKNIGLSSLSPLALDQGLTISGTIETAEGAPLVGARAVLNQGLRPSTVGTSDAGGNFLLLTREGTHSAVIVPPPSAGLPEARVESSPGIDINSDGTTMNVKYKAMSRAPVSIVVKTSDGNTTVAGSKVRAELLNELPSVATVTTAAGSWQAKGKLRQDVVTDATGKATFPDLPLGTYSVWVVPPATLPEAAVTTIQMILSAKGYAGTVALARHLTLSGTLLPKGMTAGVRLIARDVTGNVTAPVVSAIVGEQGGYSLSVDPGRKYLLTAEPPTGSKLVRTVFYKEVNQMQGPAPDWMVNTAVLAKGSIRAKERGVEGALVQVFCSASVTCLAPGLPVAETVTGADGTYIIALPPPPGMSSP